MSSFEVAGSKFTTRRSIDSMSVSKMPQPILTCLHGIGGTFDHARTAQPPASEQHPQWEPHSLRQTLLLCYFRRRFSDDDTTPRKRHPGTFQERYIRSGGTGRHINATSESNHNTTHDERQTEDHAKVHATRCSSGCIRILSAVCLS